MPKIIVLYIFYKVNQFQEIFIPFEQLFLLEKFTILLCGDGGNFLVVLTFPIAVAAAQVEAAVSPVSARRITQGNTLAHTTATGETVATIRI